MYALSIYERSSSKFLGWGEGSADMVEKRQLSPFNAHQIWRLIFETTFAFFFFLT